MIELRLILRRDSKFQWEIILLDDRFEKTIEVLRYLKRGEGVTVEVMQFEENKSAMLAAVRTSKI